MKKKNTLLKSFKWSSIGTIGIALFQLLQIIILTRFLPKEAFGLVALAVLVVNFTNIFVEMGFSSAILHVQDATRKEYSSLYWLSLIISVVLYGVIYYTAEYVSAYYDSPDLVLVLRILGLNIIFITLGQQYRILLQKNMQFDTITKISLFASIIGLIVAFFLAYISMGIYSLIYSTLISSVLSSLLFIVVCSKQYPLYFHYKSQDTIKFFNVGIYSLGSNILDFLSREVDVIIIGKVLSPGSLGVYSLVKQISLKLYSILMPIIFNVLNPFLASLNKYKDKMEANFLRIVYSVVNITFPFYLVLIFGARELIVLFYGVDYENAYKVLIFLCIFQACFSIVKPLGSLQIATGKTNVGFYWTIFRSICTVLLLLVLNRYNLNSINFISFSLAVLSLIFVSLTWFFQVKRMTSIKFYTYVSNFYKQIILLLAVTAIKLKVLDVYIDTNNYLFNGFMKIIVGLFIYFGLLVLIDRSQLKYNINYILNGKR